MEDTKWFCENCMEVFDFKDDSKKVCPKCGCYLEIVDDSWNMGGLLEEEMA